jgi:hypothetical protein
VSGGGFCDWVRLRPHRGSSRRPVAAGATLICCAVALSGAALAPAATAATAKATQAGYWWEPEPVTGLIPVPGVPAGGLYVASSPSGTLAMSALRISSGDEGNVQLTFRVAQRQQVNPPAVTAYAATSDWASGGPQAWSARPKYADKPLANGSYDADRTEMSLTVPADVLTNGIVLLPTATRGATLAPTFAISFAPPTARTVGTRPTPTARPSRGQSPTATPRGSPTQTRGPGSPTPSQLRHGTTATPSASGRPTHRRHHPPTTVATPNPSSPPPSVVTISGPSASHGVRDAAITVAVIVAVLVAVGGVALSRRRRSAPPAP